ncbi:MAG: hypothetical protein KDA60_11240 [Planctomycetales bacterium]|nr:hypothetical protein [Planctomycetales bacterium]
MLGPYSEPGAPISPSFREAPALIPSPDGTHWYLYYEQYPGVAYGLAVAKQLEGPWVEVFGDTRYRDWDKFRVPKGARHGCMLVITRKEYDDLVQCFSARVNCILGTQTFGVK